MKRLFCVLLLTLTVHAQSVLVINSNSGVKKYAEAEKAFAQAFGKPFKTLDVTTMPGSKVKRFLHDEYPDIVYAIGAKAYQYANEYLPEKEIYFSSIVDWKRLSPRGKRYGVSNELNGGMQLMLAKAVFSRISTVGVVYSRYTQNLINDLGEHAAHLGMQIRTLRIDEAFSDTSALDDLALNSDAVMIIADPLLLNNPEAVETLFSISRTRQKPIIAYHELFLRYGATLVLSADNPTIGRQVAAMIESNREGEMTETIQYPAGTGIIFNRKEATRIGVEITPDISSIATEIVE